MKKRCDVEKSADVKYMKLLNYFRKVHKEFYSVSMIKKHESIPIHIIEISTTISSNSNVC